MSGAYPSGSCCEHGVVWDDEADECDACSPVTASDARPPEHKCCVHTAHCYAGSRCAECYPDARPPSDTGTTTGWHQHVLSGVVHEDRLGICTQDAPTRPVIVVGPAEALETIARALWGDPDWDEQGPATRRRIYEDAEAVLAALTTESDVRSDTGSASDPVSKKKKGHW